jgi:hypothetical protein
MLFCSRLTSLRGTLYDNALSTASAQVKLHEAPIDERKAAPSRPRPTSTTRILSRQWTEPWWRATSMSVRPRRVSRPPTLFLIVKDLTEMQVDTNVSESDIGPIHAGQQAEFMVDAFPDRRFGGVVSPSAPASDHVAIAVDRCYSVLRLPIATIRFLPPQLNNFRLAALATLDCDMPLRVN